MIDQKLYPDVILGTGNSSQTIAMYGCFECSLLHGLQLLGFNWTVPAFDDYLVSKSAFTNNVMLSASKLATALAEILEGRNEPWNDAKLIAYLKDKKNYLIIGEVSGRGIGGTGQHFVYIDHVDEENGQVTMTYIDDPWGGLENQKVTTRYNAFGNILSLRVFKIVNIQGGNMVEVPNDVYEKLVKNSTSYDAITDKLGLTRNSSSSSTTAEIDKKTAEAYNKGKSDGSASVPVVSFPPKNVEGNDGSKWQRDGLRVIVGPYTGNYKEV